MSVYLLAESAEPLTTEAGDRLMLEFRTSANGRLHARHSEACIGCIMADNFQSQASVEENGGSVVGTVSFHRVSGMTSSGAGRVRYDPIGVENFSVVIAATLRSAGVIAATADLTEGTPGDGWCLWVDANGVHANHGDGAALASECFIEGDFADGIEHVFSYLADLASGAHTLHVDDLQSSATTPISGVLAAAGEISIGGYLSEYLDVSVSGVRLFSEAISESDHNAYAS